MKTRAGWMPHTLKGKALQLRCFSGVLWLLKDTVWRGLSLQSQGEEAPLPGVRKAREGKSMIQLYPSEIHLEFYLKASLEKVKAEPGTGSIHG